MEANEVRPRGKIPVKGLIKAVVAAAVLIGVGLHVRKTWKDLGSKGGLPRIDVSWMALAVVLYAIGLCGFGLYFVRVMRSTSTPVGTFAGLRAYLISQLGKYVPGKALVVVMRVGLVTPSGARAAPAAFAALYETLTMMAYGALVAAVGFSFAKTPITTRFAGVEVPLVFPAIALMLLFLVVVWGRVFRKLALLARMPFPGIGPDALPRFSYRLQAEGQVLTVFGWIFLGLSLVSVLRAILPGGIAPSSWPVVIASVGFATVAGFVVPVSPGGLGVREFVLWTSLSAVIDRDLAVVASLLLRLAWVVGEVLIAATLILVRPSPPSVEVVVP